MNKLTGFGVIILYQQEFDGSYYTCNLSFPTFHFGCDSECFIFDYSVSTTMMMMMMNFIHVSMYLADANWGHNIKIK